MKRRIISDDQFDNDLKYFASSETLELLNYLYDEKSDIAEKYPFLFEIASILNNYLLKPDSEIFESFNIEGDNMSSIIRSACVNQQAEIKDK